MSTRYDLMAIGEFLVDAICTENGGALSLEGHPGGAPANVLAGASRLGCSTALIAKVGEDGFGSYLRQQLRQFNIDDRHVATAHTPTTLAIVMLDGQGERSFHFYRSGTADTQLEPEELPKEAIEKCRLLHFCSMPLTDQPSRDATMEAIRHAAKCSVPVSFDPNWRPALWGSVEEARHWIGLGMEISDIAKLSEEELHLLAGPVSVEQGMRRLLQRYPKLKLLAVTLGSRGSVCLTADSVMHAAKSYQVPSVDTTGAGDAFCAAMLTYLLECHKEKALHLSEYELTEMMVFANAVGALSTTEKGGFPTQLTRERALELIRHGRLID